MALADEAKKIAREDDLRDALDRALREVDRAKSRRADLVDAIYRAGHDAISSMQIKPVPKPRLAAQQGTKPEIAVVVLSDWQYGKRTPSYSHEITESRVSQLADKVEKIVALHRKVRPITEVHVLSLGDTVEGEDIFPGQPHLITASLYRQLTGATALMAAFNRRMLSIFDTVDLWAVDGNHGRFRKDWHPESNADRILHHFVGEIMAAAGERRFALHTIDPVGERNWYHIAEIGNYRSLLIHGDQFRTTAGMPWYSMQKKAGGWALGAIEEFVFALSKEHDTDLDFGHWHQPTRVTLNRVTARCNGSTESHNTYAQEQLAAVGRPSQGLRFVDPVKGRVTAEYTLWLDD